MSQKKGRVQTQEEILSDLVKGIKKYLPALSPLERRGLFHQVRVGYCLCGHELDPDEFAICRRCR